MQRSLAALGLVLALTGSVHAHGLLIPTEKQVPPLAMLNHTVTIAIEEQVAITTVEQTFRNHTDRQLEATYIFPVPKGASVRKFVMWVDGKEQAGELVEAEKARKIYTDIVRRTLDPGLLEYMGTDLLKVRVFPVPPRGDQKLRMSYTSVAPSENGLVSYVYPLKTDGKAITTLEKFAINLTLKSQHAIQNIYSPTHAVTVSRPNDKQAYVAFDKDQGTLDKDFLLYYTLGTKDVGLTSLAHRPTASGQGYFMMLISPRAELSKEQQVPRDMVFVLDTSGSMRGKRMTQARSALKYCLNNLEKGDRFAILNFATTVNKYNDTLLSASTDQVGQALKWVDQLEATGGTAINDALLSALEMRPNDPSRTFTVVFFTDGRPTIGETNSDKILKNVLAKNNSNTRIFTFGVGDDVNATMLDQLAEGSRAVSTYVRESEDIETRVSNLYAKISNPVLTNLKLAVTGDIKIADVYPPQLPDLFHGSQLVVLGRYTGDGHSAVKLQGNVGKLDREFVYELNFPAKTPEEKPFVEDLWARRKVGYLLDQIRANGEKKELVDEVVTLAKRYGITTPYTSYLIVPDSVPVAAMREAAKQKPNVAFNLGGLGGPQAPAAPPAALQKGEGKDGQVPVLEFLKKAQAEPGGASQARGQLAEKAFDDADRIANADPTSSYGKLLQDAKNRYIAQNQANAALKGGRRDEVQAGKLGVDLSVDSNNLRNQTRVCQTASRYANSRNCLEVGGVWIDEGFDPKMKTVTVKAMSDAYFRLLERHPSMREVFTLGNHLVWVSPSRTALVIDSTTGVEQMSDSDIDALFVAAKK